ncbi:hypothetical protein NE686_17185 [Tissierella carlieri]|uniref:Uncharacterized protein n=1 Tax=Tissierella carlieri TaxID=689904 RepID=A0ABT1SEK2_9FIRM|nr:hypothetical protein [Tissierella carlieri]MCQ4924839.1 hypothetical protein [Tissierella carlieri]
MGHPVPKELKGEERLFVIPGINKPINKKSLMYNGPATLMSYILGQVSGSLTAFVSFLIILNIIAYPLGNSKISRKKFDNGFMDKDMYLKKLITWKLRGGGNVYISHKFEGGK